MSGLGDGKDFSHRLCLLASDSPGFFTIMNNRLLRDKEGASKHSTLQPPPPSPLPPPTQATAGCAFAVVVTTTIYFHEILFEHQIDKLAFWFVYILRLIFSFLL